MRITRRQIECAVCGTRSEQRIIQSMTAFGHADLDTRPPAKRRPVLSAWIQHCPRCGYCHREISESREGAKQVVASPEYQRILARLEEDGLAALFRCRSLIDESRADYAAAAWSSIHAAWAFDDAKVPEAAVAERNRALSLISRAEAADQPIARYPALATLIVVDLLRRAGRFEEAQTRLEQPDESDADEEVLQLLDFESRLIRAKDGRRRNILQAANSR